MFAYGNEVSPLPSNKEEEDYRFRQCMSTLMVAGAVGALYGPLHGGANEAVLRMLERIGHVDNIPKFIDGVKNRKEKMFGFGHRSVNSQTSACRKWSCEQACVVPQHKAQLL